MGKEQRVRRWILTSRRDQYLKHLVLQGVISGDDLFVRGMSRISTDMVKALKYIEKHATQKGFDLKKVARAFGVSRFHFHRQFKEEVGKTIKEVSTAFQMVQAQQQLVKGRSCNEIAMKCGFANQGHFANRFKMWFGKPPTQWLQPKLMASSETGSVK